MLVFKTQRGWKNTNFDISYPNIFYGVPQHLLIKLKVDTPTIIGFGGNLKKMNMDKVEF